MFLEPTSLLFHSPLPWFLPGSIRIRGGAARDFSSVWPFHRGIHPEATCAGSAEISTHFQGLTQPALRERWIPVGIQGNPPRGIQRPRKPLKEATFPLAGRKALIQSRKMV